MANYHCINNRDRWQFEVSEVQESGASVVCSLGPVTGREMKKEDVKEGVAKAKSSEEITTAERGGTRRNEKREGKE